MNYSIADLDEAEARIRAAVPGVEIDRTSSELGFTLVAVRVDKRGAALVFQPDPIFIADIADVIEFLKEPFDANGRGLKSIIKNLAPEKPAELAD